MNETDKKEAIAPLAIEYVEKIKALCEENNCKLVLVSVPSAKNWNYERHNAVAEWAEKEGVSLVLVNTEKGTKIWESVKDNMEFIPVQIGDALQPCLQEPREKPIDYNGFWYRYKNKGFASVIRVYANYGYRSYLHKKAVTFCMKVKRRLRK